MTCPCGGWKPTLREDTRCGDCQAIFDEYVEAGWGLDDIVKDRLSNEALGLCFDCGGALDGDTRRCVKCQEKFDQDEWNRRKIKRNKYIESDPYSKVWEANDTGVYLTPTLDTLANRMIATARHHERMAEQGGPRGKFHAEEAKWRFRVAEKHKKKYNEVGATKVVNWYVKNEEN